MGEYRIQLVDLTKGAGQLVSVNRGDIIFVRRGDVVLRLPMQSVAETVVCAEARLTSEESHIAICSGLVELMALSSAQVGVVRSQSTLRMSCRWLRQLVARITRRRGPFAIEASPGVTEHRFID